MTKKARHNHLFSLLVLLLIALKGLSQSKVYTFIQENSHVYEKSEFYIQKVIDARDNKFSIGSIYSSDKRKKYPADFNQTLSNTFYDFFKTTFPSGKHKSKIVLLVIQFNIDHQLGETAKDIGIAEIKAEFYLNRNDTCFYLNTSEQRIEEQSEDVLLSHPNRIKRLLLLCTAQMIDSLKTFNRVPSNKRVKLSIDELKKRSMSAEVQNRRKKQGENTLPGFYLFKVGTYYSFSQPVLQFGFTTDLVLQIKKAPQYLIGINANMMLYGSTPDNLTNPLTTGFDIMNYDLGIKLLKQVRNNFFINLNPQVNLGYIQEQTSGSRKNILGLEVDAGVYLIPPDIEGVYTGLNLFYRGTNTEFLGTSFGLKLDLGYRF